MQDSSGPKKALLDDLESIVDILDDAYSKDYRSDSSNKNYDFLDIPLLDDVVIDAGSNTSADTETSTLLNLSRIFNDEQASSSPLDTETLGSEPLATEPLNSDLTNIEPLIHTSSLDGLETASTSLEPAPDQPDISAAAKTATLLSSLPDPLYYNANDSDEEQSEMFPIDTDYVMVSDSDNTINNNGRDSDLPHPASVSTKAAKPIDLTLVIQELVDEFIPALETQLRNQLTELAPAIIHDLAEKHLK